MAKANVTPISKNQNLEISSASVKYLDDLDLLVFEQQVEGTAGATTPTPRGALDGVPVLGYVFPTTLQPEDVGFSSVEGTLALVAVSHPDFDDTPLWDENCDGDYNNDGAVYHSHWVVLVPDERVPGRLAVKEFEQGDPNVVLPPTNPGMPMYMDSPGLSVVLRQNAVRVLVPAWRVKHKKDFKFDAIAAYMEVNTSDESRSRLGVYDVYSLLSGDLSLPYSVTS